jgi:beta-lactam-binding protein with PASTA domain
LCSACQARGGISIRRFIGIAVGALGMIAVALISAFITMRLAIHGREAVVPPLTGLSLSEAATAVIHSELHMTVENRFYSANVPAGHVIAQDPPPGFHVRRDWPVRITESLGTPQVAIPNLLGQSERAALISIRQLGLEPGAVIHLPAPGEEDVVIAQTPSPDSGEVTSPRISLVVSDPEPGDAAAYVMPSLVGLSYAAAAARVQAAGLHLLDSDPASSPIAATPSVSGATAAPGVPPAPPHAPAAAPPSNPAAVSGTVLTQTPAAGSQVQQGHTVRITLSHLVPVP